MQTPKTGRVGRVLMPGILHAGMENKSLLSRELQRAEKELYDHIVIKNEGDLPQRVREMWFTVMRNLLHSAIKAFAKGLISEAAWQSLMYTFTGKVVMAGAQATEGFRLWHGYDPPSFITVSPTNRCNLHCAGCYAAGSARKTETLNFSVLRRVIREKTADWSSYFTVIRGDEPLLYRSEGKDLFDVFWENPDNYFLMFTNATLITKDVAKAMAQVGNVTPAISVEGFQEETDGCRGQGVFRKIMRAMENLQAAGVPFGISVTATRENAEFILSEAFIDFYFEQHGAMYGWIIQYMPMGPSHTIDLMVTPQQRRWMLEQEMKLIEEKRIFLVDFWNGGPLSAGCIAAGRPGGYLYIDWNGNIAPCVFFPYSVDNLYEIYSRDHTITSVLEFDFFRSIRNWQDSYAYRRSPDEMKNLFLPCAIRDHYDVACDAIDGCGAKPMDESAAAAVRDQDYRAKMLAYDRELAEVLDPIWGRDVLAYERPDNDEGQMVRHA
jgi:MoaA/NifB/PqqE/SkfB family radical SAM enzyme